MQQGSITEYAKKNGRKSWGYYIRLRDDSGKLKAIARQGFATKTEAQEARDAALGRNGSEPAAAVRKLAVEEIPKPAKPSFAELLDQFLSDAAVDCTLGTLEAYRKQSRYPVREFGGRPIDEIMTEDLQRLFHVLRTEGGDRSRPFSPKTLKHVRFLVKRVFDLAIKLGHLAASPLSKDVRIPKLRKKPFRMPEKTRLKEVIARARGRRFYPILELTAATGARMGEVLALLWSDYNAENRKLEISKALEDTRHGVRVKGTKSEEQRIISLPPSIVEVLAEHQRNQEHDKAIMGSAYDDQGYIFAPPQGGHYRPSNVSTRVSAFLRGNGLALSMHKLRHAHASILLSEGAPPTAVADRLGHANPAVTLELYSHVINSDRDRLAMMWDDEPKFQVVTLQGNAMKKTAQSA
jgi:integrase